MMNAQPGSTQEGAPGAYAHKPTDVEASAQPPLWLAMLLLVPCIPLLALSGYLAGLAILSLVLLLGSWSVFEYFPEWIWTFILAIFGLIQAAGVGVFLRYWRRRWTGSPKQTVATLVLFVEAVTLYVMLGFLYESMTPGH